MTWVVISCVSLLVAISVMLLVAAIPSRWRREFSDGLAVCLTLACLASLTLHSRADAQSPTLPPLEQLAEATDTDNADTVGAEAERSKVVADVKAPVEAVAETAAVEEEAVAEQEAQPAESSHRVDEAAASPSKPIRKRVVELPDDFAAPDRTVEIPDRPEWVDREPQMIDDNFCIPISSALHVQQRDCRRTLNERLVSSVADYIEDLVGSKNVEYFIHYDLDEIRRRFVVPDTEFHDIVKVSVGPMHQAHALLQFPPEFRAEVNAKWAKIRQTGRVVRTAGGSVGLLAMLGLMFGYFRLDAATKGYYTRRLQMVLVTAILALIAVAVIYFRSTAELIYRMTM